VKRWHL